MGRVLIIGEKATARTRLGEELAAEGHTVAITGTAALIGEFLFTLEPDIVLLDVRLNRVDQWWVMDEMKRQSPHVSLVPYTSSAGEEEEFNPGKVTPYMEILKNQVSGILEERPPEPLRGRRVTSFPGTLNLAFKAHG